MAGRRDLVTTQTVEHTPALSFIDILFGGETAHTGCSSLSTSMPRSLSLDPRMHTALSQPPCDTAPLGCDSMSQQVTLLLPATSISGLPLGLHLVLYLHERLAVREGLAEQLMHHIPTDQ